MKRTLIYGSALLILVVVVPIGIIVSKANDQPFIWMSIDAPIRYGQRNKATDSWDITSIADASEKVDSLQFQVTNKSNIAGRKTSLDYIYVIVRRY